MIDMTKTRQNPTFPIDESLVAAWEGLNVPAHDKNRIRSNYLWGCIYGDEKVRDRWEKEIRSKIAEAKLNHENH